MSRRNSIGTYSERTRCPRCGEKIRLEDIVVLAKDPEAKCPACETPVRPSQLYRRTVAAITLVLSCLLPCVIGAGRHFVIAWIPSIVLSLMFVPNMAKAIAQPRLESYLDSGPPRGTLTRNVRLLLSIWLYCAFGVLIGILGVERLVWSTLGASGREVKELFMLASEPLGEVNGAFRVGPHTSLLTSAGIVFANTLIWSAFLFPISKMIRGLMKRNRVVQSGP